MLDLDLNTFSHGNKQTSFTQTKVTTITLKM